MITVYSDRMEINWINMVGNKVGDNNTLLNETRQTIIAEIRNNPNVTKAELTRQVFYFCNKVRVIKTGSEQLDYFI